MKHYETLGVEPTATPKDIKRAFRLASMRAHPDREGGSEVAMAAVNAAYQVLSSPERRAKYDQTGDDKQQAPIQNEAMSVLAQLFTQALEREENMVVVAKRSVEHAKRQADQDLQAKVAKVAALQSRRDKIKVAEGQVNLAHAIIDGQIVQLTMAVTTIEHHIEVMALVRTMLDWYSSDEAVFIERHGVPFMSMMGAGTTTAGFR